MKNVLMKSLLLVGLSLASVVQAAPVWHDSTISALYPQGDGSVKLVLSKPSDACVNSAGVVQNAYIIKQDEVGVSEKGLQNMYSALLLAFASDKTVEISFDSETTACYIDSLIVKK